MPCTVLNTLHVLTHFILTMALWHKYIQFIESEMDTQRSQFAKSHPSSKPDDRDHALNL